MAEDGIVIIATGPLTSDRLSNEILSITGQDKLFFYDAAAPIIEKDSINMDVAFWGKPGYVSHLNGDESYGPRWADGNSRG